MKHLISTTAILLLSVVTWAQDYSYLRFDKADGTSQTMDVPGLKIVFDGSSAIVTSGSATTSLSLSSLSSMVFTNTASADTDTDTDTDITPDPETDDNEMTGITSLTTAATTVASGDRSITVTAEGGTPVTIYTAGGMLIARETIAGTGVHTFPVGAGGGMYIVRVGSKTTKIMVR